LDAELGVESVFILLIEIKKYLKKKMKKLEK